MRSRMQLISGFLFCVVTNAGTIESTNSAELKRYVENRFGVSLDSNYVIRTHTREDIRNELITEYYRSADDAEEILKTCAWRTNASVFIDSVYARDASGRFHGFFLDYSGDSLSTYGLRWYDHGKKDSVELTYGCLGSKEIGRYKDGVEHGIWEKYDNDGARLWLTKYEMGQAVDTAYEYHQNGNVLAMRYYDNGKLVWEKCYEEDGTTEMECDF